MTKQEDATAASKYKERSVAEQKSLDIAWNLLMEPRFRELVSTICNGSQELQRFRQLLVNALLATDLGDKEMKALRNGRWDKAFNFSETGSTTGTEISQPDAENGVETAKMRINRKATIVVSTIICCYPFV